MAKLRDLINESKFLKREFGEPLPTFKGVMKQHQINKLEEGWWDNMSDKAQAAYIKKYGEAPDANGEDEYPDKDPINTKKGEMEDEMEDIANELDNVTDPDEKKELEDRYDKIDQELYDINKKQYGDDSGYEMSPADDEEPDYSPGHPDTMDDRDVFQFLNKDEPEDEGEPYKREPFQPGDDPEELSLGAAQDELEKAKAELAQVEDESEKKSIQQKIDALQGRIGRTGDELNQETLTINGKQYNRISEGVEKQPKPKYEFSEFYKRFKG